MSVTNNSLASDSPNAYGRDERAHKRKGENDTKVTKEVFLSVSLESRQPRQPHLLELVARVENNRRKEEVEEQGVLERLERCQLQLHSVHPANAPASA